MPSLSNQDMMAMDPRDIASAFGCHYNGDLNPFDHGGIFYRSDSWRRFGYAEAIGFTSGEERTWVESGTINKHEKMERNMRLMFKHLKPDELVDLLANTHAQIQECFHQWGMEPQVEGEFHSEDSGHAGEERAWLLILRTLFAWKQEELSLAV